MGRTRPPYRLEIREQLIALVRAGRRVSPSGFYAWRQRTPSARAQTDFGVTEKMHGFHVRSRGTHGGPRIHSDLRKDGVRVSRARVARLPRADGLVGVSRPERPPLSAGFRCL